MNIQWNSFSIISINKLHIFQGNSFSFFFYTDSPTKCNPHPKRRFSSKFIWTFIWGLQILAVGIIVLAVIWEWRRIISTEGGSFAVFNGIQVFFRLILHTIAQYAWRWDLSINLFGIYYLVSNFTGCELRFLMIHYKCSIIAQFNYFRQTIPCLWSIFNSIWRRLRRDYLSWKF